MSHLFALRRLPLFCLGLLLLTFDRVAVRGDGTIANCTAEDLSFALNEGGLIKMLCDGTISLGTALQVSKDTTLDATGRTITINASGTNRLFRVNPGVRFTLLNLRLTNGKIAGRNGSGGDGGEDAFGAALYNDGGIVTLSNVTLSGHTVTGGNGGDGAGGGNNAANGRAGGRGGHGLGAAIFNDGVLTLLNCTFSGNQATAGGGGKGGAGGTGGLGGHGGDGGEAGRSRGGGIFNTSRGRVTAEDAVFTTNRVAAASAGQAGRGNGHLGFNGRNGSPGDAAGAAIFNDGGVLTVLSSTFSGNVATGAPGPNALTEVSSRNGAEGSSGSSGLGAAVSNSGSVAVTNCTFYGNIVVGGNGGAGGAAGPSSFSGKGGNGGAGGDGKGGALFNAPTGISTLVNCTFAQGSVRGGTGGTAGVASGPLGQAGSPGADGASLGGALYNSGGGVINLRNSILAGVAGLPGGNAGGTPISDLGYNLSSDHTPVLYGPGSRTNVNPQLGALGSNGGPTPTMALATNSPARDAIPAGAAHGAPDRDQRRFPRYEPFDIGAFEISFTNSPSVTIQFNSTNKNVMIRWPVAFGPFILESKTNVLPLSPWTAVADLIEMNNGTNQVTLLPAGHTIFFRLRK